MLLRPWLLLLPACASPKPGADAPADTTPAADSAAPEDTAPPAEDTAPPATDTAPPGTADTADTGVTPIDTGEAKEELSPFELCFQAIDGDEDATGPNYDQFEYTLGSHCYGTNHQDITGVERVVFLGDSVTVGTPPSGADEFYRNLLADELASRFGLEPPDWLWENVNLLDGASYSQESGDFATCAEWGARADDLMQDDDQVLACLPEDSRDKVTLVIMTVGGNDLSSLTEGFMEGKSHEELWAQTYEFMALVREAVEWIKAPGAFPAGVHVVFTNLYEFTDATGDVTACPLAELAGFGAAVTDPELEAMVIWSMEEYMSIAVDTGSDMLFLLETFCGHGFNYDDPDGRCYRGEDAELWFDLTCIHPNPTGHAQIADMFGAVVSE